MTPDSLESASSPPTPIARAVLVGGAAASGWVLLLLLLAAALPVLFLISLLDARREHRLLRGFGGRCLGAYFVRFLGTVRFHRVVERPDPGRVRSLSPCVFVANHRSWLDGLLALALFPGVLVPVNASYLRIPLLGRVIRWSGGIIVDRRNPATIVEGVRRAGESLAAGHSLFVFPEGTRGHGRGIGPFSDLFFRLARDRAVPVVPVVLHSDTLTLSPAAPRFMPWRRARWLARMLDPRPTNPLDRPADIARRARAEMAAVLAVLDGEGGTDETRDKVRK